MMRSFVGILVVVLVAVLSAPAQSQRDSSALVTQARELEQKRQEILKTQIELLKQQLDLMMQRAPGSEAVLAMQSILDLELSQVRVRDALNGARIVASDGCAF